MIDYVDPIPSVVQLLNAYFNDFNIYGNSFPPNISLPSILVKSAGGNDYIRLMILVRSRTDITAMSTLIDVMNYLERYGQHMQGIRVKWVEREQNPVPQTDQDSGLPEAWCYMRVEALEGYREEFQ